MRTETLDDAIFYSQSAYLRIMIGVRVSLAFIALILLAVLHVNRKKFVAHRSLSVLLDCHFFWVCLLCLSVIAEYSHLVINLIAKSPAHLIHSDFDCLVKILPQCIGIYGSICSLFMMSVERYTSSTSLSTYETSHKTYGYKLAAWHMLMIILLTAAYILTYGSANNETAYCKTTSVKGKLHNPICAVFLATLEASTIVVFTKLLRKNERRLKSATLFTLTEKYQITENVRMIRIMLPVVWSHVLITSAAIIAFFIVTYIFGLSQRYYPLFEDSINLVFLQGICMPIFFLRQFRQDASRARAVMATNTATGEERNATYAVVLRAAWNSTGAAVIEQKRSGGERQE